MVCVRMGNTSVALRLYDEMVSGNGVCKPNVIIYGSIIDGLCTEGRVEKARELFFFWKGRVGEFVLMWLFIVLYFMVFVA